MANYIYQQNNLTNRKVAIPWLKFREIIYDLSQKNDPSIDEFENFCNHLKGENAEPLFPSYNFGKIKWNRNVIIHNSKLKNGNQINDDVDEHGEVLIPNDIKLPDKWLPESEQKFWALIQKINWPRAGPGSNVSKLNISGKLSSSEAKFVLHGIKHYIGNCKAMYPQIFATCVYIKSLFTHYILCGEIAFGAVLESSTLIEFLYADDQYHKTFDDWFQY
jgi:hypothetical protein